MGDGRAEQRHDAVAHHLVDGSLVAVDGLHHALEDRVQEPARLLGVAVCQELHGALEVGEEHGDLLALSLEGAPRGEDPLGEVCGGVGLRRGEARLGGRARCRRPSALGAELGRRRQRASCTLRMRAREGLSIPRKLSLEADSPADTCRTAWWADRVTGRAAIGKKRL